MGLIGRHLAVVIIIRPKHPGDQYSKLERSILLLLLFFFPVKEVSVEEDEELHSLDRSPCLLNVRGAGI